MAYAVRHWRPWLPRLLSQSAFNRRISDLCGALNRLGPAIAARAQQLVGRTPLYEVTDGVPSR